MRLGRRKYNSRPPPPQGVKGETFGEEERKGQIAAAADNPDADIFLPFLDDITKILKATTPERWKRKYGEVLQQQQTTLINSFETTQLDHAAVNQLMPMHERAYFFQENASIFTLPTISSSAETVFPKRYALPVSMFEKLVKDNLELLCLMFLEKKSQSGYQLLKNLAQQFNTILSQGTLYPMLYNLKKSGKILATKGKGRETIYELSSQAKNDFGEKKRQLMQGWQHIASFFE